MTTIWFHRILLFPIFNNRLINRSSLIPPFVVKFLNDKSKIYTIFHVCNEGMTISFILFVRATPSLDIHSIISSSQFIYTYIYYDRKILRNNKISAILKKTISYVSSPQSLEAKMQKLERTLIESTSWNSPCLPILRIGGGSEERNKSIGLPRTKPRISEIAAPT